MSGSLEQFLQSFTGGAQPDPKQAEQYHERFVSTAENDRDFDNDAYQQGTAEYLQQLPDDQFQNMARNAVAQVPPQNRADLLGPILGALTGAAGGGMASRGAGALGSGGGVADLLGGLTGGGGGGGLANLAQMLGLGSSDPRQMSEDDAAKVMNYARKENPTALRQAVQDKPWFVKAMGNPVVMGALAMAAQRLLSGHRR